MKISRNWSRLALATALLTTLAACGGGGSDAGGSGEPVRTTQSATTSAPVIVQQALDAQVLDGADAVFTVVAEGDDLSYQWERSVASGLWSPIAGATQATLKVSSVGLSDGGSNFRVKVSRGVQVTISSAVSLTVTPLVIAPSIIVQPQSVQVTQGADATFTLTASGTSLAYRWQTSTDGITWVDATDGNGVIFVLKAVALAVNNLRVHALVSNGADTTTSEAATLTVASVTSAPAFINQPTPVSVSAPATATFSATVSGVPQPALQWQKSVDGGASYTDVPGANSASYTTPATSESQTGNRFRLVASNSAGTITGNAATLTVSAASTLPLVTTQPIAVSAAVGASASFSVAVSGVPTPSLQWQLSTDGGSTFSNINGATSSNYSHVAAANESGWLYRVVVSNSRGSVTSQNAALTVTSSGSVLRARAWTPGLSLESSDDQVVAGTFSAQAIDDQGAVTVVFVKVTGDRLALHAVRGVPGAAGSAPVFGAPVVIDAEAPFSALAAGSTREVPPRLVVSPNGNALAGWSRRAPCGSTTYRVGASITCSYWYVARYIAARAAWEPPVLVGDMLIPDMEASINDAGDVAGLYGVTTSPGDGLSGTSLAVGWKGADQAGFTQKVWPFDAQGSFFPRAVTLDNASRLVVSGTRMQGLSTNQHIAVYRGTIAGGLNSTHEVIDVRGATASYMQALGSPQGQQVILWSQNNGTKDTVYAATLDAAAGTWVVTDTGESKPVDGTSTAVLTRSGDFIWYFWRNCASMRRLAGTWGAKASLPASMCNAVGVLGSPVVAPNGNVLSLLSNSAWLSYDAGANEVIATLPSGTSTGSGYLLGFDHSMSSLPGTLLLSAKGVGAFISVNGYSVIPRSDLPSGDNTGINNVWGWYLK